MKNPISSIALTLLFSVLTEATQAEDTSSVNAEMAGQARELSMAYGKQLKGTLIEVMKAGGPEQAIAVCNVEAPAIAKEKSDSSGWSVGRTALKLRNPKNAPDDWERTVLEDFQEQIESGADIATLETYETTTKDGKPVFRYMKAIPTQGPCLACHGSNVSTPIKAKIDSLYPDDKATGFEMGELRGAFTLIQPMP